MKCLKSAPNDPAFKRRGFSVFMKVTELISYLKVKNAEPLPESALKRLLGGQAKFLLLDFKSFFGFDFNETK